MTKTLRDKAAIGFYEPIEIGKKIKWNMKLSQTNGFFCERQEDAQIYGEAKLRLYRWNP